jgi:hypothetical protein
MEYDGKPVPADDLVWAIYSPCGCQSGVIVAQSGSYLIPDEATAWKEFFESAAIRKREQKRGYTFKLLLRQDGTKMLGGTCGHTPKWGVPDTTPPEGLAWAKEQKGKSLHLIPYTGPTDRPKFVTAEGGYDNKIASSCGREHWGWEVDGYFESEYLTCPKCEATLTAAVA